MFVYICESCGNKTKNARLVDFILCPKCDCLMIAEGYTYAGGKLYKRDQDEAKGV